MKITDEIQKMEAVLRDSVIDKFLKLEPETWNSKLCNETCIETDFWLIENKSRVDVIIKKDSVTFEIKEKVSTAYYTEKYSFKEDFKMFGDKKHKAFKNKVRAFFEFKTNEERYNKLKYVLANNIDNQEIRKAKLEQLNNENGG